MVAQGWVKGHLVLLKLIWLEVSFVMGIYPDTHCLPNQILQNPDTNVKDIICYFLPHGFNISYLFLRFPFFGQNISFF